MEWSVFSKNYDHEKQSFTFNKEESLQRMYPANKLGTSQENIEMSKKGVLSRGDTKASK